MQERTQHEGALAARDFPERLANGLGWFSLGLGLAEVITPGSLAEAIGLRNEERTRSMLRLYGIREIAAGVGILSQARPEGWMWGRVGGDLLDLATLASAGAKDPSRAGVAQAAVLGVAALDVYCASQLSRNTSLSRSDRALHQQVKESILINGSPDQVYRFWRDLENLPRFLSHLESVQVTGERRSRWKARLPAGLTIEWNAEIVEDQPNSFLAWRSVENSDIEASGSVRFEPGLGGRGTLIRVELRYSPPGGAMAAKVAKILGADPGSLIKQDLRALKQILETGEIVQSDASIHRGMHPAQPAAR
jgi:uncharacterized membrane protein